MKRNDAGGAIVEAGAALSLLLPLIVFLTFAVVEISYAYLLKSSLSQGARQAARDLAIAYGKDPKVAGSRSMQESMAFDKVRLTNIINSSAQFQDPVFDTSAVPHTVAVTVRYTSGQNGLPLFPNPDPLNIAGKINISGESTYRLE